jgi:hypothetical protein
MKISWLKEGSFDEEFLMEKINRREGTRSLVPGGDVAIMAGKMKNRYVGFVHGCERKLVLHVLPI